jgi:Na+/melibiose symporter-like transporter
MSESRPQAQQGTEVHSVGGMSRWSIALGGLTNRDFRWYWLGRLTSLAAFQMDGVAQGWLVYELTGSALSLGWVSASRSVTLLLVSLYGGVLSDRFQKRSILIWIRWIRLLAHLAVALLISLGAIQVWHLAARAMVAGVLLALIMPAERAIVPELVDRKTLLNAFSLTSIATGLMGVLAAWVAGLLIDMVGVGAVYYAIVVFHLLTVIIVAQLPRTGRKREASESAWTDLVRAVRYITHQPVLLALLGLALATVVLARPYRTLMPTYAKDVMGFGCAGLGMLTAAPELGSLLSSVAMASLGRFRGKGKLLLVAGTVLGASLLVFGNVRVLGLVLFFLILAGFMNNICLVVTQTLLQVNAEDQFLGRVMSLQIMMSGLVPLGALPASAIADRAGVPVAVSALGALLVAIFGVVALLPRVRRLE